MHIRSEDFCFLTAGTAGLSSHFQQITAVLFSHLQQVERAYSHKAGLARPFTFDRKEWGIPSLEWSMVGIDDTCVDPNPSTIVQPFPNGKLATTVVALAH